MRRKLASLAGALALALAAGGAAASGRAQAPTAEELRALIERVVASQHRNDAAIAEYERFERVTARKSNGEERIVEDKSYRVFPTGTGTIRVLLEEKGQPVKPETLEKGLRYVERALEEALDPSLPRQKSNLQKWEKRTRERREMLDAIPEAFQFTWLGRETRNGRAYAKVRLEPAPDYKGRSRNISMFSHIHAVLWIDETEAQVARLEADIFRDISIGGGVFGKVYKGGRFVMEQAEVAEGIWLPVRYEYDFDGRRFVFPFSVNEVTEARNYRRIGPPAQALAQLRRELNGRPASGKPAQSNGAP
jgi:hypothetical protein